MQLLDINPQAEWTTLSIGDGAHRVVIADNVYAHAEQVGGLAQSLYYYGGPMHGNFPGARAVVSLDTRRLIARCAEAWGSPLQQSGGHYQPVVFSAIRNEGRPPLNNGQRQPHIDPGVSAMVYLNHPSECAGGTGIYRHVPTGLERIPVQPSESILELAKSKGFSAQDLSTPDGYVAFQDKVIFAPEYAAAGDEYINDGNDAWELIYKIEMRFNRLVIFDGRMPHSQHLAAGQFAGTFRLNQILYLEPQG